MAYNKIADKDGFIYNEETKRLESYQFIKAEFTLGSDVVTYYCKLGGQETRFCDSNLQVYASERDYEIGKVRPVFHVYDYNLAHVGIMSDKTAWMYEDGHAVKRCVDDVVLTYTRGELTSATKMYMSREDVFKYNDYKVLDADGKEHVVTCIATRMRMTEEQQEILERLRKVIKEAEEHGIRICYDYNHEQINAYNVQNTTDVYAGYLPEMEDGYTDVYEFSEKIGFAGWIGSEDTFAVVFKN